MTENHSFPITPPPELVQQWLEELYGAPVSVISPFDQRVLIAVAQWGADQELEACCEWLKADPELVDEIRADRRPKPPSFKEQAIAVLDDAELDAAHYNILLRALEALPDD